MNENSRERRTSISKASTPPQIGEFWDSHSLADYSENIREVSLELDARLTDDRAASVSASRKSTLNKSGASKMNDKFSRICWNTAGWRKPTGDAASVETKDTSFVEKHGFGLEEWLFNSEWMVDEFRYGFLQPIGKYYRTKYKGKFCSILLYTVTPEKDTLLVARIANVYIPEEDELDRVLKKYGKSGWMDSMRTDIDAVGGDPTVLDNAEPSGIVNIRFQPEKVEIFDPRPRVTENHKICKSRYHPFDWDGSLPETEIAPPPLDEDDPARSERERTRAAQEGVRVDPRHVRLQNRLYRHLCKQYGISNVWYENSFVDLTLKESIGYTFFEIKMELTAKRCIRSALGQLLEYAHYPTGNRARRLVVVGDVLPTDDDRQYVSLLREKYQIPIYYRRFRWETNELEEEI